MGEDKKKRRLKVSRIFFVKTKLTLKIISGFVKSMNLIQPKGFFVEGVES